MRDRILGEMGANLGRRGGPERIQLRYFAPDPSLAGQRLSAIAERRRLDPVETALALILEADGDVGIVSFNMRRDDFETFARQPWVLTASDGSYPPWGRGVPHPRGFGTFPRVVAELVERDGLLSLEEAIDRASRGPARLFGLADRGVIAEGAHADIVVFDRARFRDLATFTQPYQLAEGVRWVVVNGVVALEDGQVVRKAGVVLRSEIAQR